MGTVRIDQATGLAIACGHGVPGVDGETFEQPPIVTVNMISGSYLHTLSIPLRRGRTFTDADREGAPRVALIGQALARELWPGEDPIGKRIRPGLGRR